MQTIHIENITISEKEKIIIHQFANALELPKNLKGLYPGYYMYS